MNLPFCWWYVFVLIAWFDIYYFFIERGVILYSCEPRKKKEEKNVLLLHWYLFFHIGSKINNLKNSCGDMLRIHFWLFKRRDIFHQPIKVFLFVKIFLKDLKIIFWIWKEGGTILHNQNYSHYVHRFFLKAGHTN